MALSACALITACASSASGVQVRSEGTNRPAEVTNDDAMERLKHAVERLAGTEFDDIEALNGQLHAVFGPLHTRNGLQVRSSQVGTFAGIALNGIELRSATDNPRHATLTIDFPASGLKLETAPWPAAVLHPPHPDAPGSRAYWSLQIDSAKVVIGLAADHTYVTYISISKG